MTNIYVFEDKILTNDIKNNDTMIDNEVVASDVPRGTWLSNFCLWKVLNSSIDLTVAYTNQRIQQPN